MRIIRVAAAIVAGLTCLFLAGNSIAQSTPIKHVVVIFQENQSFDHYFGTYPVATNSAGEPAFTPKLGTPTVNGLTGSLLTNNPNLKQPFLIDRSQAKSLVCVCDNDHGYSSEQAAYDGGLMDQFVPLLGPNGGGCTPDFVMGYVDGNTVTALWNYAQNFAMSDNHYGSTFGPSIPGAINLASGQTGGATPVNVNSPGGSPWVVNGTMIGNPPAAFDDCAEETGTTVHFSGQNIGNLLNTAGLTWGWFAAGFTPTAANPNGTVVCGSLGRAIPGRSWFMTTLIRSTTINQPAILIMCRRVRAR